MRLIKKLIHMWLQLSDTDFLSEKPIWYDTKTDPKPSHTGGIDHTKAISNDYIDGRWSGL